MHTINLWCRKQLLCNHSNHNIQKPFAGSSDRNGHSCYGSRMTGSCFTGQQYLAGVAPVEQEGPVIMQAITSKPYINVGRRITLAAAAAMAVQWLRPTAAAAAGVSPQLMKAFQDALAATSYEDMEAAWSRAIDLSPNNAAAWSNRGTARLQAGRWQAAADDLQVALQLEQQQQGSPSALLLNNLGNAEGALGRWQDAMQLYQQAADDDEVGSIALANYALAAFETGQDDIAIKSTRQLLRRDPEFLDMRCALTAFLWASGQRSAAEDSWEQLQQASDGLGAALYSRSTAVERVRHRWPPRATAALVAFLSLSDVGRAEGYDLQMHEYKFAAASLVGAQPE